MSEQTERKTERVPVPRWRRKFLEGAINGDGSPYYIFVKKGRSDHLCIFLSGGGMAWNAYTAARPVTGGKVITGQPNYYWNNLRPISRVMNINIGITDNTRLAHNPFTDWNFVVVCYATGDFHVGDAEMTYQKEDGEKDVLHFHGYNNFLLAMEEAKRLFPSPDKLLFAGDSAGAFAVPALAGTVADVHYPECNDITLFSDSALLLYKGWKHTLKKVWKADRIFWEDVQSDNLVLDWYRALTANYGERFRYLYASSTHDYVLSSFANDILKHRFGTDAEIQEYYYEQLKRLTGELSALDVPFHYFIYDFKVPIYSKGGTVHTAVRQPWFYRQTKDGVTMAGWLKDAVDGNLYDVGMSLLQ